MKNNHQNAQREFLFISLSFFILTLAWVGFNLYHIRVVSTISPDLQMQIVPISPNFDLNIINNLKKRQQINPLSSFSQGLQAVTPTVTPILPGGLIPLP
jgi:hypothetical protein